MKIIISKKLQDQERRIEKIFKNSDSLTVSERTINLYLEIFQGV